MYMHNRNITKKSITKKSITKTQFKNDSNDEGEEDKEELVNCVENHIYLYCYINNKSILSLITHIKTLNVKLSNIKNDLNIKYDVSVDLNIYLHINSNGGYITDALAAINYIEKSKIPIVSIIDGYAASAATLLSVSCSKRQITKYSSMLIHQLSGSYEGTYEKMKDDNINNKYLFNLMKNIYIKNSNNKLTHTKLNKFLKHDLMWGADICLKNGLVDEII